MSMRSFLSAALFLAALHPTFHAQHLQGYIQRIGTPTDTSVHFGAAVTVIGDVDGDGRTDLLIGDDLGGPLPQTSSVLIYSRSGSAIFPVTSALSGPTFTASQRLGAALCFLGIDVSGFSRVVAGAPSFDGVGTDSGRVSIASVGLTIPAPPVPSTPTVSIGGLSAGEEFGTSLATLGDLTGDGLAEFLVGAPKANIGGANAGRVSLHNGATGAVIFSVNGTPGSLFGSSIAAGLDIDLDGVPDFAVGAPNHSTIGTNRGSVSVMSGMTGALILTLNGNSNGDNFGRAVAMMRDLDGDGRAEIAVSAPGDDVGMSNNGAVTIHSGLNGSIQRLSTGERASDLWGQSLASGDADRDGKDDILVGSPFADRGIANNGAATLYSGADGSVLWHGMGRRPGGEFGHAVAFIGESAGNGLTEFAVTEWINDKSVSVYSFAPPIFPRISSITRATRATSVADIDGDGKKDIAFREPAPSPSDKPETVTIVSAATGSVLRKIFSPSTLGGSNQIGFGIEMTSVGDIDADGIEDIAIGEFATPNLPSIGGSMYVFSGSSGALIWTVSLPEIGFGNVCRGIGDTDQNGMPEIVVGGGEFLRCFEYPSGIQRWATPVTVGYRDVQAIAAIGDVNGDGATDVVVGGESDSPVGSVIFFPLLFGSAFVVSGLDGAVLYNYFGPAAGARLGNDVAAVGDQNADGVPDFSITSFSTLNSAGGTTIHSGQTGNPLFTLPASGEAYAVDDLTGDGLDDLVVASAGAVNYYEGGTGAPLGGSILNSPGERLVVGDLNGDALPDCFTGSGTGGRLAIGGAYERGSGIKGTQRMHLGWNGLAGSTAGDGAIEVTGGTPSSTGFMMVSLNAATLGFGPYVALIDVFDPSFQMLPYVFDGSGSIAIFADLFDPALQGFTIHCQAIDTTPSLDGTYSLSNALAVQFMP